MIRVASYCRVSTDKDDQVNSLQSQRRYFKEYIMRHPDWELYDIYADEGITGTSTKKRAEFNRMISDAYLGCFQLVITKEVSRFSRNILDAIRYTRELKALGIGVLFMNDGINTLEPDAELRLSIMGSIAQEESRKTSSRVKWGQTRRMEQGVVFGPSMLGYDVQGGKLKINSEGAELVKMIFYKYGIEKKGSGTIAKELQEAGYCTYAGNTKWSGSHIIKILKNEKYVGDLVQKKTITVDYLTHKRQYNHGEEELITIHGHHEPIIDRWLWNIVQEELVKRNRRGEPGAGHSNRYAFSGKIKCGECGASFVSRTKTRKDGSSYKRWGCYTAANEGIKHLDALGNEVGCDVGKILRDSVARNMVMQAVQSLRMDTDRIIANVTAVAAEAILIGENSCKDSTEKLENEISRIMKKREAVLDAYLSQDISKEDMHLMNSRYDEQLADVRRRLKMMNTQGERDRQLGGIQYRICHEIDEIVSAKRESDAFIRSVLDKMVVCKSKKVIVQLNLLPHKWEFVLERVPVRTS